MKWTMISLALAGTLTYALIFLAQIQSHNAAPADVAEAADAPFEVVAANTVATLDTVDVSNPVTEEPESFVAQWEGDAWAAGVRAFESGDYEQARAALEVAAVERETSPYRHYLLGLTLRRVGELEGAREELTRSIELAPGQVRALVNLARVELDLGETDAAREAVDLALEHDLEFADSWHLLGRIELQTGNFEGAAVAFRKAVERDEGHSWAWNNLGFVRIQQDRFDDAVDPLLHAVSLREESVFLNNLGVALEGIGEETAAALAFARAAGIGSEKGETSYDRLAARAEQAGTTVPSVDEATEMAPDLLLARLTPVGDDESVEVATLEESEPIEAAANEDR